MGRDRGVEFSTTTEVARVADYLSRIADGLRRGQVVLVVSDQTLNLKTANVVKLNLEAGAAPDRRTTRLGLEITWRPDASAREGPGAGSAR